MPVKRRRFLLLQRGITGTLLAAMIMIGLCAWPSGAAQQSALDDQLARIAPPPSTEALVRIPETGRKLLALRSYLRYGPGIAERWSWTEADVKLFQGSPEQRALTAEIDAISKHFASANPGYQLYVHSTIRSLDEQITKWNANASVGAGAEEIQNAYTASFGSDVDKPADDKDLIKWLRSFQPSKRANLAAPGLTLHGRASAIDFQVMKAGKIYAGADTKTVESVWRAESWDEKLKASVAAAGPSFFGPLTNPDEPWHYDYTPAAPVVEKK